MLINATDLRLRISIGVNGNPCDGDEVVAAGLGAER